MTALEQKQGCNNPCLFVVNLPKGGQFRQVCQNSLELTVIGYGV